MEGITMAATTMVHVRVDENVKAQAAETLASMGLTVSDAIRVFLTRVVADKELPFAIKAPSAASRAAMAEASEIIKSRRARFATSGALINALEEARSK
jgi:DNA-damage-inducible protein J